MVASLAIDGSLLPRREILQGTSKTSPPCLGPPPPPSHCDNRAMSKPQARSAITLNLLADARKNKIETLGDRLQAILAPGSIKVDWGL